MAFRKYQKLLSGSHKVLVVFKDRSESYEGYLVKTTRTDYFLTNTSIEGVKAKLDAFMIIPRENVKSIQVLSENLVG